MGICTTVERITEDYVTDRWNIIRSQGQPKESCEIRLMTH